MSAHRPNPLASRTWKAGRRLLPALAATALAGSALAAGGDPLTAPTWNSPFRHAQAGKQEVKAVAFDASGNAVAVGYTQPVAEDKDIWVAKVRADGTGLAWAAPKTYDRAGAEDVATAVTVDGSGNIYVAGHVWNGSNADIYTAKYAADGTLAWQTTWNYAARNGDDLATAIAVDSSGYVYVAGHSQAASGDDGLLLKYAPGGPDVNGAPAQTIRYDGGQGNDLFYAVAVGTGGVVVTGTSRNASGNMDLVTVKYAAGTGALAWQKRKVSAGDNTGWLVKMDTAGNAYVAASVVNGSANRDIYVARLAAADGTPAWERTHDGGLHDDPKALELDASGSVYVTGTVDTVAQALNVQTLKYAADGTPAWGVSFNTTNGDQDVPRALAVDSAGDVFVAGYSYSAAGANYNFLTLKHKHDTGQVLWSALYQGPAGKDDQALGVGLQANAVVVAGWSNSASDGSEDYDLTVAAFDPGHINAPTALSAAVEVGPQVTLSWTDNADNEDGFCVQRRDATHAFSDLDCTLPAHPGTGTVVYTDATVAADTAYWYRVRARSAALGDSGPSNEVYVRSTVVVWGSPAWVYQHAGDSGVDKATAIAVGPDGNPVVTGLSFFMVDALNGSVDYYTAKIDRASADAIGDELWGARYADEFDAGDEANSVAVDSQNRVIVTGYATLDSGQAENTNDLLTIFYPAVGPPGELTDQYAGPGNNDDRSVAVAAAVDGSDNVAVVGYGKNASLNDDIYVLKYSSAGARLWAAAPYDSPGGGWNDYPTTVAFDPSGHIFAVGYVSKAGGENWWIAKHNGANGASVWTPTIYGAAALGSERPEAVAVDAAGNAYVAGYVRDGAGKKDLALVKINGATGAVVWHKEYLGPLGEDDEAVGVEIDPIDGTILVAGTTTVAVGDRDLVLIRYDAAGNVVELDEQGAIVPTGTGKPWSRVFDRPGFDDAFVAMDMDVSGNLCVAGSTIPTAGGNKDVISVKYDYLGNIMGGVVYNGAANGNDEASAVAVNRYGEAFIAGYVTSVGGTADYLVFKCVRETLEVPSPFTVVPRYTTAVLTWSDNTFTEDGFTIQRKAGAGAWEDVYAAPANTTTWTDAGLGTGQSYSYRMRSRKGGDVSRWTPERAITTLTPPAPGTLVVAPQNTTTMRLTWVDTTTGEQEDRFVIQRCEGSNCTYVQGSPTSAEYTVATGVQTYDDVLAQPDKVYTYVVYAERIGLWTSALSAATASNKNVASPTILAKEPLPFSAARVNEEKIDVTWSARTTDHSNFQLQRCTGDATACTGAVGVWADVTGSPFATGTAATSDTTAPAGGTYRYRIRAHKNAGAASWDTVWSYSTAVVESITAPVLSVPVVINTTQVNLGWTDGTANETNFVVQRCPGSGTACDQDAEFTWSTNTASNATGLAETAACPGTQYTYRVKAWHSTKGWSSTWSTQLAPATPSPVTPTNLVVTGLTESTIGVSWADNTLDRDQVTVYRCDGTGCDPTTSAGTFSARPGAMFHFEETSYPGTAGDVKDSSTNLAHGTSSGGVTSLAAGRFGRGATFDGTNDAMAFPHQGSILPGTALTIELWAKSSAATWAKSTAMVDKTTAYEFETTAGTKTLSFSIYTTPTYTWTTLSFTPDATVDITQWHHYAATYDGATMRIYVDGVEKASMAATGTVYTSNGTGLYLGYKATSGVYWAGSLDDVAIHLRTLPALELLDHAAYGAQRGYVVATGLAVGATYTFKATADKAATCKTLWPVTSGTASAATVAPPAPENLTATVVSTTQLNLGWTDKTSSETGFQLQRCLGTGTACDEDAEFVWNKALPTPNTQAYSDTEACAGTQYTYRVRAQKTTVPVWDTLWTPGTGTTPSPAAASDVSTTALTESTVKVFFRDRNSDETGYRIERCPGTGAACDQDAEFALLIQGSSWTLEPEGASMLLQMEQASWTNGTANQVADASGNTNHGTPYNHANTVAGGVSGRAATFDGTDDYVALQYKAGRPANNFTLEAWVKPTATHEVEAENTTATSGTAGQKYLFSPDFAAGSDSGAGVSVGTNGISVYEHAGGYMPPLAAWSGTLSNSAWTHVVVTYTNKQPRIYVNGVLVRTGLTSPRANVYAPMNLGGMVYGYYAGQADNVVVMPRALSDAEVLSHYSGGLFSHTDTTASPGTAYTYRITPYKTATCPWPYQWVASVVTTPAPPKPTGLAATAVNSNRIDLAWNDLTGNEDRFRIERCTGDAAACTYDPLVDVDAKFSLVANVAGTVGTSAKTYSDASLTTVCAGTTYTYRVRAEKYLAAPTWNTAWNDQLAATTKQAPAPAGPNPFAADRYTEAQVNLAWTNASTNAETGLQVQRCTDAACSSPTNVGGVLAAGTASYSDRRLPADQSYWYRVQVQKTGACGWGTPVYSAIDPADTELREPTALGAATGNTTTINLTWTRNTATDTDTLIQRCAGALATCCPAGNCTGTFTDVGWAGPAATTYADGTAAHSTTYTYRVKEKNQGLGGGATQSWSYRAPITGLTANTVVEVPVTWRAAMRDDFGDLRVYDETAKAELPYWIKAWTSRGTATLWVKVGANTANVYLYYGNGAATTTSSDTGVLELYETFRGAAIDTTRWTEIDPDGSITQNNDLVLTGADTGWTRALISKQTFARAAGKEVYLRLTTGTAAELTMLGWEVDQTTDPSYVQLVYGLWWVDLGWTAYEKGAGTGTGMTFAANTDYEMKVVLKAAGATYYVKGGAYPTWTQVRDTASYSDATLRVGLHQRRTGPTRIHEVRVGGYAKAGGVAVGAEGAASAGTALDATLYWTTGDSNGASATTSTPTAPTITGLTSTTDRRVDAAWIDANPDESSFVLERCDLGDTCATTFTVNAAANQTVGPNVFQAADGTPLPSTKYYYRVRAHKDATNPWDKVSAPVPIVTATQKVADLAARADGSRKIDLTWTDIEPAVAAHDESGYEVEVLTWNGAFAKIATLPADSSSYTDTVAIDPGKTYTYRIRSFRDGTPKVYSPYSNEAPATTPAQGSGDTTCVVEE